MKIWGWLDIDGRAASAKPGKWRVVVSIKDVKDNWDKEYESDFYPICVWGKQVDFFATLAKGQMINVKKKDIPPEHFH